MPVVPTSSIWPTRSSTAGSGWTGRSGRADNVIVDGRVYVPFAPFPAIVFMPLVALFGPVRLDQWEQIIDSAIAAVDVGLCWWLMGRLGVRSLVDRLWLVILFGFSTQICGSPRAAACGTPGHLIAAAASRSPRSSRAFGRRRPWLLGLLVGAAS